MDTAGTVEYYMRAVTDDDDVRIKVLDEPYSDAQDAGSAPPVLESFLQNMV